MITNVGVYTGTSLTFYMHSNKIIVCTTLQSFRISYDSYKYHTHLDRLKLAIISGETKTVSDIANLSNKLKWENCTRP